MWDRRYFPDHLGNIFLHLSKEITVDLVILTEICAIREDLFMVAASRWASLTSFLLESDSLNAVPCFNDINKAPWRFINIIRESIYGFGRHLSWSISHIRHLGNETADVLARIGTYGYSIVKFM